MLRCLLYAGETFGLVHIEAAAQGLPVIAFDVRANAESVVFLGDSSERGQGSGSAETYGGASAGAGADAGGVVSKGVGVQSALLPYREGAVVQDLALALLTAYLQHRRRLHEVQDHQHPSRVHTEVSSDAAGYSGSSAVKAERAEVCDKVVPVFRHWNSRQHSRALVDALALFLRSASSQ
jgi:glycosyltransferase involved in cell wall biosynthesis